MPRSHNYGAAQANLNFSLQAAISWLIDMINLSVLGSHRVTIEENRKQKRWLGIGTAQRVGAARSRVERRGVATISP